MNPKISLSQPNENDSPPRMREGLSTAFDPCAKSIRTKTFQSFFSGGFFAQNRRYEFCGKYVFGVPLGEGAGVARFSCVASDPPDPSLAIPSFSVGNWLAGCRSHAPRASDTMAISTKDFFIKFRNLSTQKSQWKDSQKLPDSYFLLTFLSLRPTAFIPGGNRTD